MTRWESAEICGQEFVICRGIVQKAQGNGWMRASDDEFSRCARTSRDDLTRWRTDGDSHAEGWALKFCFQGSSEVEARYGKGLTAGIEGRCQHGGHDYAVH